MKKIILGIMLSVFTLSLNAAVTVTDNPFYSDVEVEHPLFAKGAGGSQWRHPARTGIRIQHDRRRLRFRAGVECGLVVAAAHHGVNHVPWQADGRPVLADGTHGVCPHDHGPRRCVRAEHGQHRFAEGHARLVQVQVVVEEAVYEVGDQAEEGRADQHALRAVRKP